MSVMVLPGRNPVVLAKELATLDRMSGGRLLPAFGLGAAYNLNTTRARSTTSTTYTLGTADYLHLAGDVVFKWRGVAVMGEAVLRDAQEESWTVTDDEGLAAVDARLELTRTERPDAGIGLAQGGIEQRLHVAAPPRNEDGDAFPLHQKPRRPS